MVCKKCGKKIKDTDKFCRFCGTPAMHSQHSGRKKEPEKKRKIWKVLLVILICLGMIVAGGSAFFMNHRPLDKNIILYSDGDMVYQPKEEDIVWDEEECVLYYDNLLTVYLTEKLTEREENKLARQVDGKVVTRIHGAAQVIQIKVESADFTELNAYAEKLKESKKVLDALYDTPWFVWENVNERITDKKNNEKLAENDWWAKAIGAYTAWEYVDAHKDKLSEVTVGIIDNGFDTEHEDLKNTDGFEKIAALKNYETNSAADHGTHVMGLIGANNNTRGIRGIADLANIRYVDWTPNTEDEKADNYVSLLNTGEYIRITNKMIQEGYVINNSWGASSKLESEKQYRYTNFYKFLDPKNKEDISYEKYCETFQNTCNIMARNCINMIIDCEILGYDKFLIIQSAGNGDSSGVGVDTTFNGNYASITRETFHSYVNGLYHKGCITEAGIDYETIKGHILIVGAVENKIEDGRYKMTSYSNYGEGVDICAPGGTRKLGIYSTVTLKDDMFAKNSAEDGLIYSEMPGTSMAVPLVAGSAALLWQISPDLSTQEVKQLMIETAEEAQSVSEKDDRDVYPMLNIGNAVQYLTTEKILLSNDWHTESNGTRVYRFQKDKTVFDVTKKVYGFDENEELKGDYENKNKIITFEIDGKIRSFTYAKMKAIKDSVLTIKNEYWFNDNLYKKYEGRYIFYEVNPDDGEYPIIMMPFDYEKQNTESNIREILTTCYWKYMSADLLIEQFMKDGTVRQFYWDISGDGADVGQYIVSGDTLLFLWNEHLYRLDYVDVDDIQDELEDLFGSDLSWMSKYLFYESDFVLQYPYDSDIGISPFYLLPAGETKQLNQKEVYSKVIEQKEEEYGLYTIHTMSNIRYASGVCYLELRDIDKDGMEELFLVHNANIMNPYVEGDLDVEASYCYEIWTYREGRAVQLETGDLFYSNGGWPNVCWTEYQDQICLVSSDTLSYCLHGLKKDGSFGIIESINGDAVSQKEWENRVYAYMEKAIYVPLFYQEEDTVYEKVKEVKEYLSN